MLTEPTRPASPDHSTCSPGRGQGGGTIQGGEAWPPVGPDPPLVHRLVHSSATLLGHVRASKRWLHTQGLGRGIHLLILFHLNVRLLWDKIGHHNVTSDSHDVAAVVRNPIVLSPEGR